MLLKSEWSVLTRQLQKPERILSVLLVMGLGGRGVSVRYEFIGIVITFLVCVASPSHLSDGH